MYQFLNDTVRDYMTPSPHTVTPQTSLRDLEALFGEHDFNGVPVVDSDQRLIGVVTKLDLLKAFTLRTDAMIPPYDEIMQQSVEAVMHREPVSVQPDLPLTRVLQRAVEMRTKSFPVVDEEQRVVGVIAREDLIRALRNATPEAP